MATIKNPTTTDYLRNALSSSVVVSSISATSNTDSDILHKLPPPLTTSASSILMPMSGLSTAIENCADLVSYLRVGELIRDKAPRVFGRMKQLYYNDDLFATVCVCSQESLKLLRPVGCFVGITDLAALAIIQRIGRLYKNRDYRQSLIDGVLSGREISDGPYFATDVKIEVEPSVVEEVSALIENNKSESWLGTPLLPLHIGNKRLYYKCTQRVHTNTVKIILNDEKGTSLFNEIKDAIQYLPESSRDIGTVSNVMQDIFLASEFTIPPSTDVFLPGTGASRDGYVGVKFSDTNRNLIFTTDDCIEEVETALKTSLTIFKMFLKAASSDFGGHSADTVMNYLVHLLDEKFYKQNDQDVAVALELSMRKSERFESLDHSNGLSVRNILEDMDIDYIGRHIMSYVIEPTEYFSWDDDSEEEESDDANE